MSSSQPGETLSSAWRPTSWPGLLGGILTTKYSGDNEADRQREAVSRNRGSEIKKSKQGREERAWQKEAGQTGKQSKRKSSKNWKPIGS